MSRIQFGFSRRVLIIILLVTIIGIPVFISGVFGGGDSPEPLPILIGESGLPEFPGHDLHPLDEGHDLGVGRFLVLDQAADQAVAGGFVPLSLLGQGRDRRREDHQDEDHDEFLHGVHRSSSAPSWISFSISLMRRSSSISSV